MKRTTEERVTDIAAILHDEGCTVTEALRRVGSLCSSFQKIIDDNESLYHCVKEIERRNQHA